MAEYLLLKWGTLKGLSVESDQAKAALARYNEGSVSMSAMAQRDDDAQRKALCDLIDVVDGPIVNDWSGETLTRDQAKAYVMEYPRR